MAKRTHYKVIQSVKRFGNYISTGVKITNSLAVLTKKPRARDYAYSGLSIIETLLNSGLVQPLKDADWKEFSAIRGNYYAFIKKLLQSKFPTEHVSKAAESSISITEAEGCTFAFTALPNQKSIKIPRGANEKKYLELVGRLVWEEVGSYAVIEIGSKSRSGWDAEYAIAREEKGEVLESEEASLIYGRIKAFIEAKRCRSIIFHGPPGTGKSCLINSVSAKVGGATLVVNAGDVQYLQHQDLAFPIELLQPSVLIINDFDRVTGIDNLLTDLEKFNKSIKVIMVSVNDLRMLSTAIKRPGRFDEVKEITEIGRKVVERVAKGVPQEYIDKIYTWPIAFVHELAERVAVLGVDCVEEEFLNLEARVDINHLRKGDKEPDDSAEEQKEESKTSPKKKKVVKKRMVVPKVIKRVISEIGKEQEDVPDDYFADE